VKKLQIWFWLLATSVCVCGTGCYPKHIVWTPDGQQAAIWNNQGLFFCDAQGTLSPKMVDSVVGAQWAPDGEHLVIVRDIYARHWNDVETDFPQTLRQDLMRYAKTVFNVKTQTQWQEETQALINKHMISDNEIQGIKLYIRDNTPKGFPADLIETWQDECDFHCYSLQIGLWKEKSFSIQKTLYSSAQRIYEFRFSSKGRLLAFTTAYPKADDDEDEENPNIHSLWVADIETGQVVLIDTNVALYPDWDAAGTSLVYIRSLDTIKSAYRLGTLLRSQVCDANEVLVDERLSPPAPLAGLIANEHTKLRCLSDGRIIFSSMEVTLPFVGKDIPGPPQFFMLDAKRQATIIGLIPRGVLPQMYDYNLSFFEVSPDQTKLCFPDNEGRVGVLSITTGEFQVLQNTNLDNVSTVPVWRFPSDLCYVAAPKDGTMQVVLQENTSENTWNEPRSISQGWPHMAKTGWLEQDDKD